MKLKLLLLCSICLFSSILKCITYEVKIDGTGDFTSIQTAIEASTNLDTILVYPGTYFENIDFLGKKISVTSLFIENQNDEFIHNTIIDGNQNGSCVKFSGGEDENTILCGFTIQNGSGSERVQIEGIVGGGIYCYETTAIIESCIITNNTAQAGGGIFTDATLSVGYCSPMLRNCTISYNQAYEAFGGIGCGFISRFDFDEDAPCNIYYNYSPWANDIGGSTRQFYPTIAYIDTFTVLNPDLTFYHSKYGEDEIIIQNGKIDPINNDLYVSPYGDDNNSGLSEDQPLQRITTALIRIASDSLQANTIHLASGIYSPSSNDEIIPFNCRSFVSIVGESMENTIIDVESNLKMFWGQDYERDFSIKNLTLLNSSDEFASYTISFAQPRNVTLKNIMIRDYKRNIEGLSLATFTIGNNESSYLDSTSLFISNVTIKDCIGSRPGGFSALENCVMTNMKVSNNTPNLNAYIIGGGGIVIGGHYDYPDRYNYKIIGSEFSNNVMIDDNWTKGATAINVNPNTNVDIINCTMGDNESDIYHSAAIYLYDNDIDCNIVNSILYGNTPRSILLREPYSTGLPPINLSIRHSLVEGGIDDILNLSSTNNINWLDGNIDDDPEWSYDEPFPYSLISTSPCVNTGTLELGDIDLPEYDLAGNSRIYGDSVDMGAYEFQGEPQQFSEPEEVILKTKSNISTYPNPFNPSTTFKLNLIESGNINLTVYNTKGQKVITLTDRFFHKGIHNFHWNGVDRFNREVSSGQYFVKLMHNGVEVDVNKCTLIK